MRILLPENHEIVSQQFVNFKRIFIVILFKMELKLRNIKINLSWNSLYNSMTQILESMGTKYLCMHAKKLMVLHEIMLSQNDLFTS